MDLVTSVLGLIILSLLIYLNFRTENYPPGPFPFPLVGNKSLVKSLSKAHNGFHFALIELCKRYKTDIVSLKLGRESIVVVQSEELINRVLTSDVFQARPDNFFIRLRSMGKRLGITMTDGYLWYEQRTFAFRHLHELGFGKRRMDDMIQRQLQEMLATLEKLDMSSVSLRKLLSKCVLNVLWEMITGETFKNNEHKLNSLITFMEERAKAFDASGGLLAQFPFLRFLCPNFSGYNLIQSLNDEFKTMIVEIIKEHKKTYSPDVTRDFIDAFLHNMMKNDSTSSTFTEDQLIMVCLDFFIAGSHTTSSTLDFIFLYMLLYPQVQEKVQQELDEVLRPGQLPSSQDKLRCPYVEAVILECMRLSSVTPVIGPRRALSDTSLAGYSIPKNTTILLNLVPCNMDPKKWEDPEVLKPDRVLNENRKLKIESKLFSFGKGKRRCPGEALARNFVFIFFSGVLHNYKLQVLDPRNPPVLGIVPGMTLSPMKYSIKMVKRFAQ